MGKQNRKRKAAQLAAEAAKEPKDQNDILENEEEEVAVLKENPKIIKMPSKSVDSTKRLIVVLDKASLQTVKAGKLYELLDCDRHKNLMLKQNIEPGSVRPDICHQSLLMLLDSPLNKAGLLQVYIRTDKNLLIEVHPQTRIPRTYARFAGLMVQLLHKYVVRAADGPIKLLKVIKNQILDYIPVDCPKIATSFHTDNVVDFRKVVPKDDSPLVVVIGAMAHGSVYPEFTTQTVSISGYPLSAALTCAKICSAAEEVWGIK